jgi:hypothetical protein
MRTLKDILEVVREWNAGRREPYALQIDADSLGINVVCAESGRMVLQLDNNLRTVWTDEGLNYLLPVDTKAAEVFDEAKEVQHLHEVVSAASTNVLLQALAKARTLKPDSFVTREIKVIIAVLTERGEEHQIPVEGL